MSSYFWSLEGHPLFLARQGHGRENFENLVVVSTLLGVNKSNKFIGSEPVDTLQCTQVGMYVTQRPTH